MWLTITNMSYCPLIVGSNLSKVSEINFTCQWLGPYVIGYAAVKPTTAILVFFLVSKILYEVHHLGILSSSSRKLAKITGKFA